MSLRYMISLSVACVALATSACSDDAAPADGTRQQSTTASALTCQPMSVRPCPCLTGGMGSQTCAATGVGYSACAQCPPAPPPMMMVIAGGGAPDVLDAGAAPDATGAAGADASSPDGGMMRGDASSDTPLVQQGTARGTSCGVGLPALCDLDTEKCCARSLRTDTCIEASASCDCDLGDCSVMEAYCDGPEDCPDGQVCCGTLLGGASYERFECVTSCDFGGTQRIACHQDQPTCPQGTECANSQLLTNVQVCIDPATIRQ